MAQVVALTITAICVWSATVAAVLPLDETGLVIYFTIAKQLLGL